MNIPQSPNHPNPSLDHQSGPSEQARGFMDYNEGDKYDGIGRKVEELIMKTDEFIVFLDEYGSIQWGYGHILVSSENYNVVVNRVAELETRSRFLRTEGPPPKDTAITIHQHALFSARRLLAEAVARLLASNSLEAAQGILDAAEKWIAQRSLECSRRWLLVPFGGLAVTGLVIFFSIILKRGGLPESGSPLLWVLGALLGGVGALVSNVSFNRTIPFDATAGRRLHLLEAVLRWLVGAVAGMTVLMLVQGDVLLGFMGNDSHPPVGVLVLSLLAGLSELFFPTLLHQFDKSVEATGQQPAQPQAPATPAPAAAPVQQAPAAGAGTVFSATGFQMDAAEYAPLDLVAGQMDGAPPSADALVARSGENESFR